MSTLLASPIHATLDGRPVRIFGMEPDGRILIARSDGHTDVTNWTRLVVPASAPEPEPEPEPEPAPPEPWGEWQDKAGDGAIFERFRNFGVEHQTVREDYSFGNRYHWSWFQNHSTVFATGDGFTTLEEAIAACEAFTLKTEGAPRG